MNMKILRGTVAGGVAFFLLGWLIYGILLMSFSKAHMNQCAVRPDNEMIWWATIVSCLISGYFLTLIMNWAGVKGIVGGLKTGAIIGFLLGLFMDLGFWSMTTMFNDLVALLVDVVETTVVWALAGLIIALLWGKEKTV